MNCLDVILYHIICLYVYLSLSFILSNSSIKQTPWSANTKAPPSKVHSRVMGSFLTAAVNPTALAPWPVVYTALWAVFSTYLGGEEKRRWDKIDQSDDNTNSLNKAWWIWFVAYLRNCDLATPGSPSINRLISPLIRCFSPMSLDSPPNKDNAIAVLMFSWP